MAPSNLHSVELSLLIHSSTSTATVPFPEKVSPVFSSFLPLSQAYVIRTHDRAAILCSKAASFLRHFFCNAARKDSKSKLY